MPAATPVQFVARSKGALEFYQLKSPRDAIGPAEQLSGEAVRQSRFSADGRRMAFTLASQLVVYSFEGPRPREILRLEITCADFVISPLGSYLATYEKAQNEANKQHFNLTVWRIQEGGAVRLGAFSHKNQSTWAPQWTANESHMGRMLISEVQFFKAEGLEKSSFRIQAENLGAFSISPGPYPKAAIFVKEAKGMPAAVRVFVLPNTSGPVAQKMFFRADKCSLHWSPSGRHLLAMSQTEVDSTGVSYYGETNLYFVSGDGSFDCRVDLDKEGPIHDFAWSPRSNEFIVLYGYMPSSALLFDIKCNPVFDFPVGSKNHVRWNPQGSLICFGAFGNLPGHIEFWSREGALRRVGHCQAQGSASCEWSPDGSAVLTGTLTPRLRVDNGFKIWSWDGTQLSGLPYTELYSVSWRPMDAAIFADVDIGSAASAPQATAALHTETALKKQAYRPPGLRHLAPQPIPSLPAAAAGGAEGTEKRSKEEKHARKLKEKLEQIADLKSRQQLGHPLETSQVEKIAREEQVRQEYDAALCALAALSVK